jgi:hypothetical protein
MSRASAIHGGLHALGARSDVNAVSAWTCAMGAVGALLFAACGSDGEDPTPDAPVGGPCWPLEATPGGEVELGTGDITFEALGDTLEIITSSAQSDPFVEIHARIRDLPTGDPENLFDPDNPRTKASLFIESLNLTLGVSCPATIGYTAAPVSGAFDLARSLKVGFGFMPIAGIPGRQGRITLEVVSSDRRYAKAEKVVTLTTQIPTAQ